MGQNGSTGWAGCGGCGGKPVGLEERSSPTSMQAEEDVDSAMKEEVAEIAAATPARARTAQELNEVEEAVLSQEEEEEEEQAALNQEEEAQQKDAKEEDARPMFTDWTVDDTTAAETERQRRRTEYEKQLTESRQVEIIYGDAGTMNNRYGLHDRLPEWTRDRIPTLALINPLSGAAAGRDILNVARRSGDVYRDRFFNIIDVVKDQRPGGKLDVFREELQKVKREAQSMGVRPRLISGGGDGTASFALWMLFRALRADNERAAQGLEMLQDTGNGFIWTNEEFGMFFPALAQLPLGSANDFGNILGWGQKYPGDGAKCGAKSRFATLSKWIVYVTDPQTQVVNFDLWGLMPPVGSEVVNFKIAELCGKRGRKPHVKIDGKWNLAMKEAGKPTPFFICLYFSTGFGAFMVARFQLNRRRTPLRNRLEYIRQGAGIVLESTPPQLNVRADGITIDCEGESYFPPRRDKGVRGKAYREVGFYNVNWQAHLAHGADRAGMCKRLCPCTGKRPPVNFNDGFLDMYRMRFTTYMKNPGTVMQTDKKKDCALTFKGEKGKGMFFQYDGEARFAFSPSGEPFEIFVRKVLNIPVVLGPFRSKKLTDPVDNGQAVRFEFHGDSMEEQDKVRRRILKSLTDELEQELHATNAEIAAVSIPVDPET